MLRVAPIPRLILLVLALVAGGMILYWSVLTDRALPDHRLIHGINDLFFHVLAFWVLTLLVGLLTRLRSAVAATAAAAVAIEAIQIFEPSRSASLDDLLASFAGVAAGAVCALVIRALTRSRSASTET